MMRLTGERPSLVEIWDSQVLERYCVAERRSCGKGTAQPKEARSADELEIRPVSAASQHRNGEAEPRGDCELPESTLRETVRQQTRRNDGRAMRKIIHALNRRLRGWGRYFQGGAIMTHENLDKWVRMRLRSIQRRRDRRKGRGHGPDHQRYPNISWAELGLISLKALAQAKPANPAT
jgi:hypothetical protein